MPGVEKYPIFQVILPGDRKTDDAPNRDKPPGMEDQLLAVQSHTEDLEVKMNFRFHYKFSIQFSQCDLSKVCMIEDNKC